MADTQLILETLVKGTAEARKSLDSITKGLDDLGKSTKKVDTLGEALKKNSEGFATIGKAAGVAFTAIVALGTGAVMQAGKLQDLRQQFDTLLGSAEKGKTLFLEIQKMASLTPFTSSDLASATSTMLGFGVAEEKVLPLMKQLGDISMGNASRFQLLSLAFSQMSATGRLMGQDLNQMINAGFNPLQEISKKTGKSIGELKEAMADGAISAKMVEEAMASATGAGGRFEGGMVKASKTFSGVMSTFKDNIQITLAALGGFANGEVVQGGLLDTLTKMMENLMPKLDQFTQWTANNPEMAKNILLVVGALAGLISAVVGIGFAVMPVVTAVKSLMSLWSILGILWEAYILPLSVALGTAIAGISAPVWIVIGVIAALIAAGVALWKNWDQIKIFAVSLWETLKQVFSFGAALVAGITIMIFDKMGIDIVAVWNTITNSISNAWSIIKGLVSTGMKWLSDTFNLLAEPIKVAWNAMWTVMAGTVTSVWDTVKNTIVSSMNWIIDKINFVITMANKVAKMGASSIGLKIVSLPTIPRLANGGIVKARPGGILANIGEGGQDEAVIPLNKMGSMGIGGTPITITFNGIFGKDAARSIGDIIMADLARAGAI